MSGRVGSGLEAADLSSGSGSPHPHDMYNCTYVRVIRVAELGQD